eukprot:GILI01007942.1.p2 GENE.GILI01007942.1~~GILI01007942.1.p2  ORF type:complete len:732 (-),score=299.18 GILI01007942.1:91-2286(-)
MSNPRRAAVFSLLERHARQTVSQDSSNASLLPQTFGIDTFGEAAMARYLPRSSYKELMSIIKTGAPLSGTLADQVASAMKQWALDCGATHFCHWFQPMTGATAEKHDSFVYISDNKVIMEFKGAELIKGEPDASSFPSGGLRSTFEARGYTAWDMSTPAFLRRTANGVTLCIPTAFCSWTGEALDEKTPLLRSQAALSKEATRLLNLIGDKDVSMVTPTLGCEQEFFIIDRAFFLSRPDLVASGRTVLGAKPAKGQEMEDHYFGTMKKRVLAAIQEFEWEAWRLGIPIKTRHNEVAPAQYEVAPIFEGAAIAADHNLLVMELIKEIAERHSLEALFHEKPFATVNGSGKHNNWSMSTNTGLNLLDPGATPLDNMRFLVFLTAVIRAVSVHSEVLRASIVTPGNDHRLGANEAPPAIMSVYLGGELDSVVRALAHASEHSQNESLVMQLGVNSLPAIPRDSTDRNRTSPFAFTGNKFEFRAVGSSQPTARPVTFLNSAVAESCRYLADEISSLLASGSNLNDAVQRVVQKELQAHHNIIFNGNGYSFEWVEEAARRGLPILRTTADALKAFNSDKNRQLFASLNVFSENEFNSRVEIMGENYAKALNIEGQVCADLARTQVLPASLKYQTDLGNSIAALAHLGAAAQKVSGPQMNLLEKVATLNSQLVETIDKLEADLAQGASLHGHDAVVFFNLTISADMLAVRKISDQLEDLVSDELWTLPKYSEILLLL